MLTLIPLLVAGVVTLEICVAIDMPLNFANIIALPTPSSNGKAIMLAKLSGMSMATQISSAYDTRHQ